MENVMNKKTVKHYDDLVEAVAKKTLKNDKDLATPAKIVDNIL